MQYDLKLFQIVTLTLNLKAFFTINLYQKSDET